MILHRLRLFARLAWRQYEPAPHPIPDPYRAKGRIGIRTAWQIARRAWR
jgi:hypothetical protein